jgi:hypothetical protein
MSTGHLQGPDPNDTDDRFGGNHQPKGRKVVTDKIYTGILSIPWGHHTLHPAVEDGHISGKIGHTADLSKVKDLKRELERKKEKEIGGELTQ